MSGLYANIREQFYYSDSAIGKFFVFSKNSGAFVPLCVRLHSGEVLGMIPTVDSKPNKSNILCAESFLRAYPKGKVIIGTTGGEPEKLSSKVAVIPWGYWLT